MKFELKGVPGLIVAVVVVGALAYFKMGWVGGGPTPEEIRAKTGEQIIDIIRGDVLLGQSEMLEKAQDTGDTTKAGKEIQAQLAALETIEIVDIRVRPLRRSTRKQRRNLLFRNKEHVIEVDYRMGGQDVQSRVMDLTTRSRSNWRVTRSVRSF